MRRRAWVWGLAGAVAAFCWAWFQAEHLYGGSWSGLFYVEARSSVPAELEAGTYRHPEGRGYDGQFYRLLAYDPLPPFRYGQYVDREQWRARRILVPAVARIVSVGRDAWVDSAYIAVIVGSVFLGVWACGAVLSGWGLNSAWGLVFLLWPATAASVDRMLTDATACALLAAWWAWGRKGAGWEWLLLAAGVLARETGAFTVIGAAGWWWFIGHDRKRAALCATALAPAAAWSLWLRRIYGASEDGRRLWGFLPLGWLERIVSMRPAPDAGEQWRLLALDTIGLAALAVVLLWGVVAVWRRRNEAAAWVAGLWIPAAMAIGGPAILIDPFAFGRALSPLAGWLLLEGLRSRDWVALGAALGLASTPLAASAKALWKGLGI